MKALFLVLTMLVSTAALAKGESGAALDVDADGTELLQINGALAFQIFDRLESLELPARDWDGASEKIGRDIRCVKKADWAYCEFGIDTKKGIVLKTKRPSLGAVRI